MKLSALFLAIPATFAAAQYDTEQVAYQIGTAMTHLNADRITLSNMLDNYSPSITGSRNIEQARKFWDNYLAAARLTQDALLFLDMFYYNYNATKTTLSYGTNCVLD